MAQAGQIAHVLHHIQRCKAVQPCTQTIICTSAPVCFHRAGTTPHLLKLKLELVGVPVLSVRAQTLLQIMQSGTARPFLHLRCLLEDSLVTFHACGKRGAP